MFAPNFLRRSVQLSAAAVSPARRWMAAVALGFAGLIAPELRATSVVPLTSDAELASSDAAARGTVLAVRTFRDATTQRLWTETFFRVDESFKGALPSVLRVVHPGGVLGEEGEFNDASPRFARGEERLLYLARRSDGSVGVTRGSHGARLLRHRDGRANVFAQRLIPQLRSARARGGFGADFRGTAADATGRALPDSTAPGIAATSNNDDGGGQWEDEMVTASGLLTDAANIPSRTTFADRGEPIPYLVDADSLPAGITLPQALTAVEHALAAWSAVSSVTFQFEGVTSFGMAAADVPGSDGKLRIQLHDNYGEITGATTLGVGGYFWINGGTAFSSVGGLGGRVGAQEFHLIVRSYLTLKHTHSALQDLATFEEVLCHEIGHTLGLAHASETFPEADPVKAQATMYYAVHADGRGATLGSYDPPILRKAHPITDTPPSVPARVMRIVTASPQPVAANVNEISLAGYDRQSSPASLVFSTSNPQENGLGSFSLVAGKLRYTSFGIYGDMATDPATSFFSRIWLRATDGVNASAWVQVRVVEFATDNYPVGASDGLPDAWMVANWGDPNPASGALRGPNDDADADGLTNLQEWRLGTDPRSGNSRLAINALTLAPNQVTWNARPYEIYQLERSSTLTSWTPASALLTPTSTTGISPNPVDTAAPKNFVRVRHVW